MTTNNAQDLGAQNPALRAESLRYAKTAGTPPKQCDTVLTLFAVWSFTLVFRCSQFQGFCAHTLARYLWPLVCEPINNLTCFRRMRTPGPQWAAKLQKGFFLEFAITIHDSNASDLLI